MKRLLAVMLGSLVAVPLALGDPQSASDWYKEGETQYNLGNFEKAADAFKQGYALETIEAKKPAYLYNVAQAYRQANKCKDSVFFYKRFLALKDQDTAKPLKPETRTEIESLITTLEECAKQQEALANKPPTNIANPTEGGGTGSGSGSATPPAGSGSGKRVGDKTDEGEGDEGEGSGVTKQVGAPKLVSARFGLGIAKIGAGGLDVPIEPTFTLFGGYPVPMKIPKLELDVGLAVSFTAVPYTNSITAEKMTSTFTMVLADAGAVYGVAPKIAVRGDLGLGLLFLGGIDEMGSPYTNGGAPTSGALAMFALRIAAAGEYELTPNLVATFTPAFAFSPAKSGMRDDIKSLTRLDVLFGVGYRM